MRRNAIPFAAAPKKIILRIENMNDNTKTIAFAAAAAAIALIAFVATPARVTTPVQQRVGKSLFPDLEKIGALDVKGLEIVKIQEDTGKPRTLKVKQVDG